MDHSAHTFINQLHEDHSNHHHGDQYEVATEGQGHDDHGGHHGHDNHAEVTASAVRCLKLKTYTTNN